MWRSGDAAIATQRSPNHQIIRSPNQPCGCVANLTASRLALKTERKIRIICEDCYISADFVARSGTMVRKTANDQQLAELRRRLKAGDDLSDVDYRSLVQAEPL